MAKLTFNYRQFDELSADFQLSKKNLGIISRNVLAEKLWPVARALRMQIPTDKGALRKTMGVWAPKKQERWVAAARRIGFLINRRLPKGVVIAGNVLQHGSATHKKGQYLWIPIGANRGANGAIISPTELIEAGGFVQKSQKGNPIAFLRSGRAIQPYFRLMPYLHVGSTLPLASRVDAVIPQILEGIPDVIYQVIAARKGALTALQTK